VQNKVIVMGIILGVVGSLSACSSDNGPDEFSILKNPPLVLPPDYHLRPPGGDSDISGAYTPQEIAKKALFGDHKN